MRKFIVSLLVLIPLACFATTPSPISTLNPAGSTSGQVITSSGPTSAPAWATVTLSGLGGLAKASNLSDVASVSTSRTNLGLGTAAVANTGTSGASIPLLSTANTWALAQAFTARPTFNGATPYDTGNLTIANYLTTAAAATTYAPINAAAMTSYTPTVTAGAGSFTTVSATGHYYVIGKLVFFQVAVTVTTVGTASGLVNVTLPFSTNSGGTSVAFAGRDNGSSGKQLQGMAQSNTNFIQIENYDTTSAIAAGALLVVSGSYVSN